MHRRAYIVLFIAVLTSTMGIGFIGPLLPLYGRDLGAAGLQIGMIFSGFSMARLVLTPFIGRLSDKRGRKIFLALGLAIVSLFSLAYLKVETASQLILVRVLHGAAAGLVIPIAQAYIGEISPKGREGSHMGTFTVSLFLAFGIGPLLGGPLAERFGMSAPFIVMGSLSATAFLLVLLFLPELGLHKEKWKNRVPVGALLAEPVVIALLIFRSLVSFGRGIVIPFLPFVAESRGASLSMIGVLIATNILLAGLLQIPFGRLADRVSKPFLMGLGIVASAAVIFAIPYCTTIGSLFILQAATGVAGALGFPAGLAMATQCGRRFNGMGTMMAIYNTGMSIGLILGPLGGGLVEGMFGLDNVFRGGSLVVAAGFVAFAVMMRRARVTGSLALLEGPADEDVPDAIGRPAAELAGRSAS